MISLWPRKSFEDQAWHELQALFARDDGSLPDIEIRHVSPQGLAAMYAFIRARSTIVTEALSFWSEIAKRETPLDVVPNVAELVVSGQAVPCHFVVRGLSFHDTVIPDLGVFIFQQQIALDYRMGPEWGPRQLLALFELLRSLLTLDMHATVTLPDAVVPALQRKFQRAFARYRQQAEREQATP